MEQDPPHDATPEINRLRDELWLREARIHELESSSIYTAIKSSVRHQLTEIKESKWSRFIRKHPNSSTVPTIFPIAAKSIAKQETSRRTAGLLARKGSDRPTASIVIPVHNQLDATLRCLESIYAHTKGVDFEIVVVDDASTDYVNYELNKIPYLKLISLTKNVGYLRATTRGVEASAGEFIVLLNNDTEVQKGWLTALLETFNDPTVGAVGAKLLWPNGTIQEAGAVVWTDGNARHFGQPYSPTHPDVSYARNVDYCSAACLAFRRATWDEIGGFDEEFAPAYYEDVDLCFAIQARGLHVRYQPAAEVIHHEGMSHGGDLQVGTKRYQEINRDKFHRKWKTELINHFTSDTDIRIACRRLCPKQTVLVIDHQIPRPTEDAGSVRMMAILDSFLKLGHGVSFASPNEAPDRKDVLRLGSLGIVVATHEHSFQELLKSNGPDIELVIISRPQMSAFYLPDIRRYCPNAKVVFDMVDLHFLRELRRDPDSPTAVAVSNAFLELELAAMKASDATIVVSDSDATEIRKHYLEVETFVIPTINDVVEDVEPLAGREGILFVGSFNHPPNRDAARLLATEIFPMLRQEHPDLTLTIVGSNPTQEALSYRKLPGIVHVGYVEDIRPLFQKARCMVAPLTWGAGVKGKITQSMASGLPAVTTSIGIEGLKCVANETILIGDSVKELAAATSRVLTDDALWTSLSQHGLEHASENFSTSSLRLELRRILEMG